MPKESQSNDAGSQTSIFVEPDKNCVWLDYSDKSACKLAILTISQVAPGAIVSLPAKLSDEQRQYVTDIAKACGLTVTPTEPQQSTQNSNQTHTQPSFDRS